MMEKVSKMTPPYYSTLMTYAPQPVPHWRLVLRRAWSVRFIALFTVANALNAVWPNLGGEMGPVAFNVTGALLGGLAFLSVFVRQTGFPYFTGKGGQRNG
jgi:hypothetical protein